jgi:hypothetical protein
MITAGVSTWEAGMDERLRGETDFGAGIRRDGLGEPAGVAVAPWHSLQHGLASLALGMTFAIGGSPTMLLIHVIWRSGFDGFNRLDRVLLTICGVLGCLIVLTCAVFGLIGGIAAIAAARRQSHPIALGVGGVLLNGFNLLMWLFILVLWVLAVASRAF